jgi:hypothetical protein
MTKRLTRQQLEYALYLMAIDHEAYVPCDECFALTDGQCKGDYRLEDHVDCISSILAFVMDCATKDKIVDGWSLCNLRQKGVK